jgi:hypothetical protein
MWLEGLSRLENPVTSGIIAPFLTSALDGGGWWASGSDRLPPPREKITMAPHGNWAGWFLEPLWMLWKRGREPCVVYIIGVFQTLEKVMNPLLCLESNPGPSLWRLSCSFSYLCLNYHEFVVWIIFEAACTVPRYLHAYEPAYQYMKSDYIYIEPLTGNSGGLMWHVTYELTDTCTVSWRDLCCMHESLGQACLQSLFCLSSTCG